MGQAIQTVRSSIKEVLGRLQQKTAQLLDRHVDTEAHDDAQAVDDDLVVFESTGDLSALTLDRAEPGVKGEHVPGAFRIRLANSRRAQQAAGGLVTRRYASRGYDVPGLKQDPYLYTFLAHHQGDVIGTVSIRLERFDQGESGRTLAADTLYSEELKVLRDSDAKICEFTRLAVDMKFGSKPVLAGLFHTAYLLAFRLRGYACGIIEVNPRHVVFYQRMLGFKVIGPERMNPRVNAPAVLLCVAFEDIEAGIKQFAGRPELSRDTRTLFPYGFPAEEEVGVLGRLSHLETENI